MRAALYLLGIASVCSAAAAAPPSWEAIDAEVNAAVGRKDLPGAVIAVWHKDKVVYRKAFGKRAVEPAEEPMTADTIFDLASLTKPIATATSVMKLVELRRLDLDAPVARYWPEFAANGKNAITLTHLLTHTSGLIADNPLKDYLDGPAEAMKRIAALKLTAPVGEKFIYSDVNFIVLGELVKRASGRPLNDFARERFFSVLDMKDTGFLPPDSLKARCAPTEKRDGHWMRGEVHDPRAHALGGVAGHAGLFGTADDLIRYARMILGGGILDGTRVLQPDTVEKMTYARKVPGGQRALGWDVRTGYSSNRGEILGGFGHTGFTGTSIWIDPDNKFVVVFLSNAVHPVGKGSVRKLRGRVATLAAQAAGIKHSLKAAAEIPAPVDEPKAEVPSRGSAGARTGIDVLVAENFARLKGQRVGLVTNHTGRDRLGRPTIDLLHQAEGVKLIKLFSPEHGIRGTLDEKVSDGKDEQTGLPVFSLYGPRREPAPEQLDGLDVVVYDIQDVGCRFYTYISTLGKVMEACAKKKVKVLVLDRPNPIGGVTVEGPITDPGRESFVAYHALPLRHGMTVGELARLFREEKKLELALDVVKVEGWKRDQMYDATFLPWINPSPNMRSLTQALLYPGVGLLETTNVSVGRGTDQPFEWIGAPWLDGVQLAKNLAGANLPGVRIVPVSRTPHASTHKDKPCGGVQIIVDDWAKFRPVHTGLTIAATLWAQHRSDWATDKYDNLLVHKATIAELKAGTPVDAIEKTWEADLARFKERRAKYLLYE